jgi:LmbE family N-acetylglucosaminyl deacetylase
MLTSNIGTLLGVWAHPDDEAYCSSGLMAEISDRGGRVVVVTATRGELGTDDPSSWPSERLGRLRERELRESLAEVGVHDHRWLSHRDGELDRVTVEKGGTDLMPVIAEVDPDVIVTFGPEGMTGHPDHRAISAWTTEAWRRTGRRAALWYATLTPEFHREWGELNDEVGLWMAGSTPPKTERTALAAEVVLSGPQLARKHRALRAHASQTRVLEDLVGPTRDRDWWATETFVAAAHSAVAHPDGSRGPDIAEPWART